MALTFTHDFSGVEGALRVWHGTVTYDSSYADNGEAIAASDFDLNVIKHVEIGTAFNETADTAYLAAWDKTGSKIRLFEPEDTGNLMNEIGGTDDVSAFTSVIKVYGW